MLSSVRASDANDHKSAVAATRTFAARCEGLGAKEPAARHIGASKHHDHKTACRAVEATYAWKMRYSCMLFSAVASVRAWTAPTKAAHKLRVPPRRDEDRCFYGEVGVDGSVVADVAQPRADTIPPKPPSPELSPLA